MTVNGVLLYIDVWNMLGKPTGWLNCFLMFAQMKKLIGAKPPPGVEFLWTSSFLLQHGHWKPTFHTSGSQSNGAPVMVFNNS